ncbi:MAG: S8 family serine peptidase, partial [Pseudomonas sp.]
MVRDIENKYLEVDGVEYPLRTYELLLTPNDPLPNTSMVTNARLSQAWDTPAGDHQTVLAVIDTGFALAHEEFSGRWYVSPGESGSASSESTSSLNCTARGLPLSASCNLIDEDADGVVDNEDGGAFYQNPSRLNCTDQAKPLDKSCNRLDDDGNGYVDDTTGWDFANYDNLPQAGELNPAGVGTTHGTRVAAIAAATGNNAKGIAGVDWRTKILPIQALDDDSYGDTLGVGRAIRYAAAQGADVISLSLG